MMVIHTKEKQCQFNTGESMDSEMLHQTFDCPVDDEEEDQREDMEWETINEVWHESPDGIEIVTGNYNSGPIMNAIIGRNEGTPSCNVRTIIAGSFDENVKKAPRAVTPSVHRVEASSSKQHAEASTSIGTHNSMIEAPVPSSLSHTTLSSWRSPLYVDARDGCLPNNRKALPSPPSSEDRGEFTNKKMEALSTPVATKSSTSVKKQNGKQPTKKAVDPPGRATASSYCGISDAKPNKATAGSNSMKKDGKEENTLAITETEDRQYAKTSSFKTRQNDIASREATHRIQSFDHVVERTTKTLEVSTDVQQPANNYHSKAANLVQTTPSPSSSGGLNEKSHRETVTKNVGKVEVQLNDKPTKTTNQDKKMGEPVTKRDDGRQSSSIVCAASTTARRDKQLNEVCIILDTSNESMRYLLTPLQVTLEKFSRLLLASSQQQMFRLGMVTPVKKIQFTSNEKVFHSFTRRAATEAKTAEKKPKRDHDDYLSVIAGLERAFRRLQEMKWSGESRKFVYVLTSLSGWDHGDDDLHRKIGQTINGMMSYLPKDARVLVGCWRDDNDIVLQAVMSTWKESRGFSLLSVKSMASFVIDNVDYLNAALAGNRLVSARKRPSIVQIAGKSQPVTGGQLHHSSRKSFMSAARKFGIKRFTSIQQILSTTTPEMSTLGCWINRQATIWHTGRRMLFFTGKLGHQNGEWRDDIVLKSFKEDSYTRRVKEMPAFERYSGLAYVTAIAHFLAIEYNQKHRPEHCAKIKFLQSYVVEEVATTNDGSKKRLFYAEQRLRFGNEIPRFTEFCNAAGQWNKKVVDESLLRFVQTCFKLSGGDFMLVGLNGVRRDNCYYLTVPTLLHRNVSNQDIKECNSLYMKTCRMEIKEQMEANGWNQHAKAKDNRRSWL